MDAVIFAEVLDRRGRVVSRLRVAQFPFSIGRAYDNDLILDDPHVSAHHASVERHEDGRLEIVDRRSENGLYEVGADAPSAALAIEGSLVVRAGRTWLRLRSEHFEVPPAVPIVRRSRPAEWLLNHGSVAVLAPAALLASALYILYRKSTTEFEWLSSLSQPMTELLTLGIWVCLWAILNWLIRHQARVVAHTVVACGLAIAATLKAPLFEWLHFFFASIEPLEIANLAADATIVGLLLYGHFSVLHALDIPRRIAASALAAVAMFGFQMIDGVTGDDEWVTVLPYWSRLEPVNPSWLSVTPEDEFFARLDALATELDELAAEKKATKAKKEKAGVADSAAAASP